MRLGSVLGGLAKATLLLGLAAAVGLVAAATLSSDRPAAAEVGRLTGELRHLWAIRGRLAGD